MWYLTLHRWTGDRERAIAQALPAHLDWMREQQLAGRVLIAGPSPDRGLGIIVIGHMSREAVEDLLTDEPLIAGGFRNYEVIEWEVHQLLGIGGFDLPTITAMTASEHGQPSETKLDGD